MHCKAPPSDKIRRIRKNEKREREKEFNTKKRRALTIRRAVHISVCTAQHQTAAQQQPKRINVYIGKGGKKEINYMALGLRGASIPVKQNWIVLSYERHHSRQKHQLNRATSSSDGARACGLFSNREKRRKTNSRRFGISQ